MTAKLIAQQLRRLADWLDPGHDGRLDKLEERVERLYQEWMVNVR